LFHTSASLATERDQVDLAEAMRLPFFLPDSEIARPNAAATIGEVVARIRQLKNEMETSLRELEESLHPTEFRLQSGTDKEEREKWLERQREKSRKLQTELDQLIHEEYFGLNAQEVALIRDTCNVFDESDTPLSLAAAKDIPTLQPADAADLKSYATMLSATLNSWASGVLRVSASGGIDGNLGLGLVELNQTKSAKSFKTCAVSTDLVCALQRLQESSTEQAGSLAYLRGTWVFDGARICIVKPAFKGQWTRTAALNDAADLYAHIAEARRRWK
jgi:hypothetical protein